MKGVLYGKNAVREWLEASLPARCLLMSGNEDTILALSRKQSIPVRRLKRDELTRQAGRDSHQNVALEVDLPEYRSLEYILALAGKRNEPPLVALLDEVQDPRNLGAILRSADAAGMHGIIIPKNKSVAMTPVVFKTSAGAAAHVAVARVPNLVRILEDLKDQGFWIVGTDDRASRGYTEMDYRGPTALVMGSEGRGLRRLVREHCDFLASIPMKGQIQSLNVSVAAALFFFEARRQREAPLPDLRSATADRGPQ